MMQMITGNKLTGVPSAQWSLGLDFTTQLLLLPLIPTWVKSYERSKLKVIQSYSLVDLKTYTFFSIFKKD
jgi:hypothetical protein